MLATEMTAAVKNAAATHNMTVRRIKMPTVAHRIAAMVKMIAYAMRDAGGSQCPG